MWYVGLDVHARQSSFCVLDGQGRKLFSRTVHGSYSKVVGAMEAVKEPFGVCFEATTGYGWLYERLSKLARRVVVAHPGHLRLIFRSKRKNDRIDAERLAKLLFLDEVPRAYVPDARVRAWRGMIVLRSKLVARRVAVKNRIRALLRSECVEPPCSLWSKAGVKWLRELQWPADFEALTRDLLLEEYQSATEAIARVQKALKAEAERHPAVALLMTIPGVGIRTAEAVVAYMDDPQRFGRNSAVGSYFGLVPCLDSSAGKDRFGHITRRGPAVVRHLLAEAAWQTVRRPGAMRDFYEQVMRQDPARKKIAITACAHKLVRAMHAMLRDNRPWQEDIERMPAGMRRRSSDELRAGPILGAPPVRPTRSVPVRRRRPLHAPTTSEN
jgi:transposase